METLIRIVVLIAFAAHCDLVNAERKFMKKPEFNSDLGDTSLDNEVLDPETGRYVPVGSSAVAEFDVEHGTYHFRFTDEQGTWHEASWIPRGNIDGGVVCSVRGTDKDTMEYWYTIRTLPSSLLPLRRVTLKILSGVLVSREQGKNWKGREVPNGWGMRLWTWSRIMVSLSAEELRTPGDLVIASRGLPSPMPCWISGDAPRLITSCELPWSIDQFVSARNGLLTDAAKGITVAPGRETVDLPALKEYFDTSVEQGWLEEGAYRDELRGLLNDALRGHESGDSDAVLSTLRNVQVLVDSVYAKEDSPILSEAYALFHFNIAYLLEHYGKVSPASPDARASE